MNIIFTPAKNLMDRVRYPVKFTIIFLIVLLPLLLLSVNLVQNINKEVTFLENERTGLSYIKSLRQPIEHIQQHRGMSAAFLNGATSFRERIIQKQSTVDQKLAELAEVDSRLGEQLGTHGAVANLLQQWRYIKNNGMDMPAAQAIKLHSTLVAEMLSLASKVADASEITLDPDLDSYYIGDALISGLPNLVENMGQARAVGSMVAANSAFPNPQTRTKLAVLSNNISLYFNGLSSGLQAAYSANKVVAKKLATATESNNSAIRGIQELLTSKLLDAELITIDSETVFNATTAAITGSYKLYDSLAPELARLFDERINSKQNAMVVAISTVIFVLVLIAYLFIGFYFSVRQSIDQINSGAQKLSNGDLTVQVTLTAQDEMSQVAESFNKVALSFNKVVGQISSSAEQLGCSSEELLTISTQTSQSINIQKQQTEEVATAMNEMSATVQEVARNITNTAASAEEANQYTSEGREKVDSTITAIQVLSEQIHRAASVIYQVEQDSKDINSVLDVIVGVADQTNLLALNAAIEAARAGEHGRGFAVVAGEVRTLAARTQESTKQISSVIEKLQEGTKKAVEVMKSSQQEAESVVDQATKASSSISAISSSVEKINEMSRSIAGAAEQQSVTAEQINHSIFNIDEMTKEAAIAAQQTSSASNGLARMASDLKVAVARFVIA